ncbi:two-component sensor histidine kinase [Streptomyces griseomycini]|uniref:Oxygen sensor histidine kinase NreB n=1 Tax=Streptomyces griseomycini TaxID=66895 RepID=A0A7W7LXX4_9ACTN|nr:signal transduction histidine kinase [Streptomyces griseomycini]GGQ08401.1 two-component sensor histidine kinase [Streptomyces griseomycini]GGR31888.1 two-component sensor histidine kinase [Streptomyces griseomycini]
MNSPAPASATALVPAPAPAPDLTPTPTTRALAWCVHLLVVGLLALTAGRAVADGRPHAGAVVAVAAACALVHAVGPLLPRVRRSRPAAAWWLAAVGAVWAGLLVLSADGVWVAFPLYFLQLHLLPRRAGLTAVGATALAAITAFAAHRGAFGAAMALGPALGAAVAVAVVWGYQALYRESERRRRLIEELTATRADLATAQHTAGVLAERERLAREIHDTLAQGLSSIQLLLRAAERALPDRQEAAARHIEQARQAAVDNLAEARRFVAALAPPALEGTTLADALHRLCATTTARHRLTARFRLTGDPVPLPTAHEVALLRVAQSALGNTVRHAHAGTAEVALGYLGEHVALDVVDDGAGFDPGRLPEPDPGSGGFGLAAMRARVDALGGTLTLVSAPGRGTALTARLPLSPAGPETRTGTATDTEARP